MRVATISCFVTSHGVLNSWPLCTSFYTRFIAHFAQVNMPVFMGYVPVTLPLSQAYLRNTDFLSSGSHPHSSTIYTLVIWTLRKSVRLESVVEHSRYVGTSSLNQCQVDAAGATSQDESRYCIGLCSRQKICTSISLLLMHTTLRGWSIIKFLD